MHSHPGLALLLVVCLLLPACKQPIQQNLYVSTGKGSTLRVYDLESGDGKLTAVEDIPLEGPGGPIAMSPDNRTLYVAMTAPPRVAAYRRDPKAGTLTHLGTTPIPARAVYLDIDATGRYAITASYGEGQVNTFAIAEDRTLAEQPAHSVITTRTAHACLIDPTNTWVFIPHTVPNTIYQFVFDERSGRLLPNRPPLVAGGTTGINAENPQGPRHYTYHPTLPVIYVVNELDSSVAAYQLDPRKGTLERFQSLTTLPKDFTKPNTCADIHVTPDGRFVYASNRGHNSIAAYQIHPTTGMMRFVGRYPTEPVPREFEIDTTGRYLFSGGLRSHKLAAYQIDPATGALTRIATYDTPENPMWLTAVPKD
ncbi:MAG: beta-propeller fold lactonase family protein [Planctomycetota bacterium]